MIQIWTSHVSSTVNHERIQTQIPLKETADSTKENVTRPNPVIWSLLGPSEGPSPGPSSSPLTRSVLTEISYHRRRHWESSRNWKRTEDSIWRRRPGKLRPSLEIVIQSWTTSVFLSVVRANPLPNTVKSLSKEMGPLSHMFLGTVAFIFRFRSNCFALGGCRRSSMKKDIIFFLYETYFHFLVCSFLFAL